MALRQQAGRAPTSVPVAPSGPVRDGSALDTLFGGAAAAAKPAAPVGAAYGFGAGMGQPSMGQPVMGQVPMGMGYGQPMGMAQARPPMGYPPAGYGGQPYPQPGYGHAHPQHPQVNVAAALGFTPGGEAASLLAMDKATLQKQQQKAVQSQFDALSLGAVSK
jgi:hypothetical protein